jgi:hypothetical protein
MTGRQVRKGLMRPDSYRVEGCHIIAKQNQLQSTLVIYSDVQLFDFLLEMN